MRGGQQNPFNANGHGNRRIGPMGVCTAKNTTSCRSLDTRSRCVRSATADELFNRTICQYCIECTFLLYYQLPAAEDVSMPRIRIPATEAREKLADILNDVAFRGERVLLERHGKSIAAVVSVEDLELLERL